MDKKDDNLCRLCGQLFCCRNCRRKHVEQQHADDCFRLQGPKILIRSSSTETEHQIISKEPLKFQEFQSMPQQLAGNGSSSLVPSSSSAQLANTTCAQVTTRLIRSTSTPTIQELTCVLKTTNQFLNGSQMSSICNQSSVLSTTPLGGYTPMAPKVDKFKMPLHQKVRANSSNVQTPLRQVLSQHVQRALMNHEFLSQSSVCPSPGSQPLDLRVRRSPEPSDNVEEFTHHEVEEEVVGTVPCPLIATPRKEMELTSLDSPDNCQFFTPNNARVRRRRSSIFVQVDEYEEELTSEPRIELLSSAVGSEYDDVPASLHEPRISIWNVLSSVFRFATTRMINHEAGPVRVEEEAEKAITTQKRRLISPTQALSSPQSPIIPNPKRIRGRPPIARMRTKEQSFD